MKNNILHTLIIASMMYISGHAGVNIGADVVSRYVWRGMDYGNSVSIQPVLSFNYGNFEAGAWASYPITAAGSGNNENDLYLSYNIGPFGVTITDYYFPEGYKFGDYGKSGAHIIEASSQLEIKRFSLLFAYNFHGDSQNSFYTEAGYQIYRSGQLTLDLAAGIGNKLYVTNPGGDPGLVNLQLGAAKGPVRLAYIVNPEADTNFLVLGYSLEY